MKEGKWWKKGRKERRKLKGGRVKEGTPILILKMKKGSREDEGRQMKGGGRKEGRKYEKLVA